LTSGAIILGCILTTFYFYSTAPEDETVKKYFFELDSLLRFSQGWFTTTQVGIVHCLIWLIYTKFINLTSRVQVIMWNMV